METDAAADGLSDKFADLSGQGSKKSTAEPSGAEEKRTDGTEPRKRKISEASSSEAKGDARESKRKRSEEVDSDIRRLIKDECEIIF